MKKRLLSVILIISTVAMMFVGCGKEESVEPVPSPEPQEEMVEEEPVENTPADFEASGLEVYEGEDFREWISNNREDYPDLNDADYGNFRMITTTGIKEDMLYRSSNPVSSGMNRGEQCMAELERLEIPTIINLCQWCEDAQQEEYFAGSHYAHALVVYTPVESDFGGPGYDHEMAKGFKVFADYSGPYLFHCKGGKDRTGFMAAILEALMGGTLAEIQDDYIRTFTNYYAVIDGKHCDLSEESKAELAQEINNYLIYAFDTDDIEHCDLVAGAEHYLTVKAGLSADDVAKIKHNLAE